MSSVARILVLFCAGLPFAAFASGPDLGDARSFAVLGGRSVTSRGATRVAGNVGVSPGKTIAGFEEGSIVLGEPHRDDALARAARREMEHVSDDLSSRACTAATLAGTIAPGVYCVTTPIDGTLTLSGDTASVWIFRSAGPLRAVAGASVVLADGAQAANVFWRSAGEVTLEAGTQFAGNVVAAGDITLHAGASLYGRALAGGTVMLDASTVTICCDPIALSPLLPDGTIAASGGKPPYTFTAASLPQGWSLSASGVLSRAAVAAGTYTFTVTATDAAGCTGSREYTVVVCPAIQLPDIERRWPVGSTIEAPILPPYVIAGLPLTLTRKGMHAFTVTASDPATGCVVATRTYEVEAVCEPPVAIAVALPARGRVGEAYQGVIDVSPPGRSYTFTETPIPGLTLLRGTPTTPGTYPYELTATDQYGCSGTFTTTIEIDLAFECGEITIEPEVLPAACKDTPYSVPLTASGGTPPYVFATEALPPGLTLSPAGLLSGTPASGGSYELVVDVVDTNGCRGSRTLVLEVGCDPCAGLTLSPDALPAAFLGSPYAASVVASGGTAPYTYSLTAGALPPGLSLNGVTGAITGTPLALGRFDFTVTATDFNGCEVARDYTILVTSTIPTLAQSLLLGLAALLAWVAVRRLG